VAAAGQAERLTSLIEGALRAAVKIYVDHRDWEARQQQAKHIGFLTHELRNPLTTIMMSAGKLRKLGQPELERLIEPLERSAHRLSSLVEQTLLAQRLEVHEVESHPQQIALGELLGPIVKAASERAAPKGVQIDARYDPNTMLEVDFTLATSAVQNVVDNAAKFTDKVPVGQWVQSLSMLEEGVLLTKVPGSQLLQTRQSLALTLVAKVPLGQPTA
jgi:signal transduction histidine kinase